MGKNKRKRVSEPKHRYSGTFRESTYEWVLDICEEHDLSFNYGVEMLVREAASLRREMKKKQHRSIDDGVYDRMDSE